MNNTTAERTSSSRPYRARRSSFITVVVILGVIACGVLHLRYTRPSGAPCRKTAEHAVADHVKLLIDAYANSHGQLPSDWDQIHNWLGTGYWKSGEFEDLKRRFLFVHLDGSIPDTRENGSISGRLVLLPATSIRQHRSTKEGRFTVWSSGTQGHTLLRWITETELRTFSAWPALEDSLHRQGTALAHPASIQLSPNSDR